MTDLQIAVKNLSGGKNECFLVGDAQYPTIMVPFEKTTMSVNQSDGSLLDVLHPAFTVNDNEVDRFYMGKYLGIVKDGYGLSLPFQDPKVYVNFDQAKACCEANGDGHHLATIAEYAHIAEQCRLSGFYPSGNNAYGKDYAKQYETGTVTYTYTSGETEYNGRTATGSGPKTWNHDGTANGVCDLNGNVYEWQSGYRTVDGEIQILENNNAAKNLSGIVSNQTSTSVEWKAIMPDGTLVSPGTTGTLKWDYLTAGVTTSGSYGLNTVFSNPAADTNAYGSVSFASLNAFPGVDIPNILKMLGLMPNDPGGNYGADYNYMRNTGERLASRGGNWIYTSRAGVFCSCGGYPRSDSDLRHRVSSSFSNLIGHVITCAFYKNKRKLWKN